MSYGNHEPLPLMEVIDYAIRCAEGAQNVHKRYFLALDDLRRVKAALAQQAGAEYVFLGYVSRHWHNDRAKDSQVSVTATPDASHSVSVYVASSAPGGGGESSKENDRD